MILHASVQETVPASTLALPDKLGLRSLDRLRIRPRPQQNISVNGAALVPGTVIDVWQFSGWWEGIFVSLENPAADSLQVYFPGAFSLFNQYLLILSTLCKTKVALTMFKH
jgi:hypothetical protein